MHRTLSSDDLQLVSLTKVIKKEKNILLVGGVQSLGINLRYEIS